MAKFSNLEDKSCDVSALLTILSASGYFTFPQQDAARAIKMMLGISGGILIGIYGMRTCI